jgi:protein-S-isoprenylcysteine O-methyltransferase Ste14
LNETPRHWWQGTRGEWYVVAQLALIALVFLGPRTLPGLPDWPASSFLFFQVGGILLMLAGGAFLLTSLLRHGHNLTPLPYPRPAATLIDSGPYRLVRHPMYAGGVVLAFGWALTIHGWLTFAYACVLFVFADIKSRREELWLIEKFSGYADYQRRVRKLIPFIY